MLSYLLSFFSGILLVCSFPPFNLTILCWVGLVPLLIAIEGLWTDGERSDGGLTSIKASINFRRGFRLAYISGLVFFLGLLHWISYTTAAGVIVVALYLALYFGAFGLLASLALCRKENFSGVQGVVGARPFLRGQTPILRVLLLPSLWVGLEFIRGRAFTGFGWGILGYSQSQNLPIIQIADITGVYGISFLVVLVNLTIYEIIREVRLRLTGYFSLILPVLFTLCCLSSTLLYGHGRLAEEPIDRKIRVAVIQGNVPQYLKWDSELRASIMDKYSKLTKLAVVDGPDLIIWPETSVPGWLGQDLGLTESLSKLAKGVARPILVGSPYRDNARRAAFNSAVLISGEGQAAGRYDKLHLVPFGEYIPSFFAFVARIDPRAGGGHFDKGSQFTLFSVDGARFGVLICFEDIFPGLARRFAKEGADYLVNITNDAWFGRTGAPYQHLQASVLRAVENRRAVIRCANTGVSCFIESTGRIIGRVSDEEGRDIFVSGYLTRPISPGKGLSFYTRFGDWFVLLCILVSITSGVGFFLTRR